MTTLRNLNSKNFLPKRLMIFSLIVVFFFVGCESNKQQQNINKKVDTKTIAVATYVDNVVLDIIRDSFKKELLKLGYTKESGWEIIIKSANGQPSEAVMVAEELLNLKPSVIVSISTPATKPVFDKNIGKIPHVYSFVSFPETIGISKDAKNTTGLSDGVDFNGTFEFIKTLLPKFEKLGMVYSDEPNAIFAKDEMLKLCKKNNVEFVGQFVSKEDGVRQACQTISDRGVDAIIVGADSVVVTQINAMVEVANARRIPLFTMDEGTVEQGGLAALSVNYEKFGRQSAILADKVIKAKNASSFEQQTYLGNDIVINLKTAKIVGLDISKHILNKAYKVFK